MGLFYLIAWLPYSLRMGIGNVLGRLTHMLARERRYITTTNIRLCFPELGPEAQQQLVKRCFIENGIGLIETTTGWMRPAQHFQNLVIFSGHEHLEAALAQGRGVLLIGAHYTTLDFSANLMGLSYPFAVTYRAHRNPLFDAFMLRGRLRNCNGVFDRNDIRGAFRHLKQGKILWYAPDQDYGPEQAVYAPFFGRQAATITAGSRFAAFNKSPVVMVRHHRLTDKKRYVLEYSPVTPFPSGDDIADATLVNGMLEQSIRMDPAQYLWMHKRFKTQPHGKPQSPYILVSTPKRTLNEALYEKLTIESTPLPESPHLQLKSGLQLWRFPGVAKGLFKQRHPVWQLDAFSKKLRSNGVVTVTTDSIFLLPFQKMSSVTCHIPRGAPLNAMQPAPLGIDRAATFLARVHDAGFCFARMDGANLLVHHNRLAILDPLCLTPEPYPSAEQRWHDIGQLLTLLALPASGRAQFLTEYLRSSRTAEPAALRALVRAARERQELITT
jgi:Kdo2-lipid IVA lauroyltransferase/acyltransferase